MSAITALLTAFLACSTRVLACPATIFNVELDPQLTGDRDSLRVFVKDAGSPGVWRSQVVQLDPVSEDGRFLFFKDESWQENPIEKFDRMTIATESFGAPRGKGEQLPCRGAVVYQLEDKQAPGRYAYLTSCPDKSLAPARRSKADAVAYLRDASVLETKQYRYEFNLRNNMLFKSIHLNMPGGATKLIAADSDLLIKSDVKKFFTLRFDSGDIESYLEKTRPGPIGTLARVSFFLRVLFFKIRMSLTTDVTFYANSGHIPMMVHLPIEAPRHLNPGSGILYSWRLAPDVTFESSQARMPTLVPADVAKGVEHIARTGVVHCRASWCRYRFVATMNHGGPSRELAMEFELSKDLVSKGFFPQFVPDVASFNKDMGWGIDEWKLKTPRLGLYFEVSGLPAGGSPWDFWLRLGTDRSSVDGLCPRGVNIRNMSQSFR